MRTRRPVAAWVVVVWVVVAGLVSLITGCASWRGHTWAADAGSAPRQRHPSLPSGCTRTITRATEVAKSVAVVAPGDTVCFAGTDLAQADVTMTTSGTSAAPIRLVADELVTVRSVQITADHVIVEGFTVAGGDGVQLAGSGITARNNTIHDTQQGGITCQPCTDSTIESNTMTRVASAGIWITGQRITVHANTITATVPRGHNDADGIRFFGNGHRITGNTIRDLSARGYPSTTHPDCFQTYDENTPATYDVVISGNTCRNVDAQCLIATGDQHHNSDAPTLIASITFVGNTCATNAAHAINLRRWPRAHISQNAFTGPNLTQPIVITEGSTGTTALGNTTTSAQPTTDIDNSSRPGSHTEPNNPG